MSTDVTQLLNAIEEGDPQVAEKLLPLVYEELRRLAAAKMSMQAGQDGLISHRTLQGDHFALADIGKKFPIIQNSLPPPLVPPKTRRFPSGDQSRW